MEGARYGAHAVAAITELHWSVFVAQQGIDTWGQVMDIPADSSSPGLPDPAGYTASGLAVYLIVRHQRTNINMEDVMREIAKTKPVLVTGGSGYLASWIIKMLLEQGINVNATVRDPSSIQKVEHLKALAKASTAQLKLFKSDLMDNGSTKWADTLHYSLEFFVNE